jgi:1-phosphofructokinase
MIGPVGGMDAVTVTLNPAIDLTISVPNFRLGEVNRVVRDESHAGGKGVNVAAFLHAAGVPVLTTGLLGRPNAAIFDAFFTMTGIPHDFVRVSAATRTGIKVVDDVLGTTTDLNFPGFHVGPGDLLGVEAAIRRAVTPGCWVVLAGSLPPGAPDTTYRRLVAVAHECGAQVAVDTSGPALGEALQAGPDLAKPNAAELEEVIGRSLADRDALVAAARELAAGGIGTVVVSLGAAGAVFVRSEQAVLAVPPPVRVASTVGAGDAMVAGAVTAALRGLPLTDTAALATAFSAVKIAQVGPQLDAAAVKETAPAVSVETLA